MTNVAVFASGFGSNFEILVKNQENYKVVLLVCDNPNAKVIERAKKLQVKTLVLNPKDFSNKDAYEKVILEKLHENKVEFIALAGYMRLIGNVLLKAYKNKIVNIHPSLLPAFRGFDAIGQAIDYGVMVSGVTVHYIDEGIDTGKIIAQVPVKIEKGMTREHLEALIHPIEHQLYPKVLNQLLK